MVAVSPMTKISGGPGAVRSGSTWTRPALSAGSPSHAAAGEARTPAAQRITLAATRCSPIHHALRRAFAHRRAQVDFDAQTLQRCVRVSRKIRGEVGRMRGPASISSTRALRVSICRNSSGKVTVSKLGNGAGQLDARGAAADDHESEPRAAQRAASLSRSARSKESRIRRRIAVASSSVLSPGA